jgi:hypothetical protein
LNAAESVEPDAETRWQMTLWQDIRYGFRMLAASPGFTTVAVLSLAIGIGANCAIFSFADALLLRPLPVARPGEVLSVGSSPINSDTARRKWTFPDWNDPNDAEPSVPGACQHVGGHGACGLIVRRERLHEPKVFGRDGRARGTARHRMLVLPR